MPKEIIKQCEDKMMKTIESLKKEFTKIRTGKANPSVLNGIMVEYYGSPMPINQIASVSAPEPQMIVIKPYDKSILKDIEKAVQVANLGFNPQNDGDLVRILVPKLTEQTRKELVKDAKKLAEDNKVAVRNVRREAMDQLKKLQKDSAISEDELKRYSDDVQKVTDKYIETIDKVSTKEPLTFNLRNLKDDDGNDIETNLTCYITDIMADSLIAHNYFYEDFYGNYEDYFAGKYFKFPGMNEEIYIKGIIFTDYNKFAKKESVSDEEYEYFYLYDANYQASYYDNKAFYGALFMLISDFVSDYDENQFVSTSNLKYTYDDFIFKAFEETNLINNVKVSMFTDSMKPYIIAGDREGPKKPKEGELEPIMVSKKFYDLYIKADLKDTFPPKTITTNPDPDNPDNLEYGDNELINPTTGATAVFSFYGYKRITTSFNVKIVGVIDNDDEATIYFCNKNEDQMYYNYLKTSYSDYANDSMGGYLILKVSDDLNKNATLYSDLTSHDLVIDNISYVKLQVVNDFIDSNLILFLGIFFALCLFSILMIFNYVVITIKNSRKDIGIYMSLGMNGFKISFIYLFQVLLVSASAFILASIGANIFLKVLDHNLSATAANLIMKSYNISIKPIDFTIFKLTKMGYLISLAIAFVAPLITIAIPLISLSRKKPIDVIKIS